MKKYEYYILGLILLYGFILRILYLDYMSMWIDETISASAAKAIFEHGKPLLASGVEYSRAQLFHYLMAFFIWIFDGDFGARFISVIFGTLTIYLAYLFSKKYIKTDFAKFAFPLLVAISVMQIIYSKQARFYQMFQFFYFLSFFLFYKFIILKENYFKKRYLDYISLIITIYLTIHLQFMGYILIPLFFIIYVIHNKQTFKTWWFWVIALISLYIMFYVYNSLVPEIFWPRVELYSFNYYRYYFAQLTLSLIALGGLILALYKNWKFNLSFAIISIIPLFGLFFMTYFATRYAYFIIFAILFYTIYLFNEIKFKYIIFAVFIFILIPTIFTLQPLKMVYYDPSMPLADYKGAYDYLSNNTLPLVVTWSPATYWYGDKADYQINYSLSGTGHGFWRTINGRERFVNAIVVNNEDELPQEFILVMDEQGARKIPPGRYNFNDCEIKYSSYNIFVSYCNG